MGKIYVVMGKSATGKDTIYKRLLEDIRINVGTVVTYTTRPIRIGEENGREYFFVNEECLERLTKEGKIIEHRYYDTVLGRWHYFMADDGQVNLKKGDYLMITTLKGYDAIIKCFGNEAVVPIYIEVEAGIRLERSIQREREQQEPKFNELCRRFLADEDDFREENLWNLGIDKRYQNINLDICTEEIIAAIVS